MSEGPLIEASELRPRLDEVVVCDMRWTLSNPDAGRATYLESHLPGAVFVDLDRDLAAPPGPGRHPLPPVERFAGTLGRLGISPESEVVVYDDTGGVVAARMWWMLESIGHRRVRLLNGGHQTWVQAGYEVDTGEVTPEPTVYPVPEGYTGVVTHDQLEGRIVLDARAGERYRGEVEPIDPKAGHIPGAICRPATENLGEDGRFLESDILAEMYGALSGRPVVSCGSGVNACHDALAMVVAGFPMPDVYVGSFSEWSRLDLPVATGAEP